MMHGSFLATTQETRGHVVEGQEYNHTSSSTKKNHNYLIDLSFLMLQVNQGLQKWAPEQDIAKGLPYTEQYQFFMDWSRGQRS